MKLMGNLAPVSELGPRRAQSAQAGKAQHLSSPSVQRGWREESPVRSGWRNLLDWGEDASGKCEGKSKDRMRIMNERWKTSRSPKWRRKGYSGIYGSQLGRMNNCFHCQDKAQGSPWQSFRLSSIIFYISPECCVPASPPFVLSDWCWRILKTQELH